MENNRKGMKTLSYMAYGDSLGFLKENNDEHNYLQPFSYSYNQDLKLEMQKGQWSYITQLTLINCKCFIDSKKKNRVLIDYTRMTEEIKLWQYYRCDTPLNYIYKLDLGKNYYTSDFYWKDKRGEAFSRIIPIVLVNKNFDAAQEETYKNIVYTNRHPQIILTGLLLLRTIYLFMNNEAIQKEGLINGLKDYLADLQLLKLERSVGGQLQANYKIKFEQEKVDYLISLDRVKTADTYNINTFYSKDIFLLALINLFKLCEGGNIVKPWRWDQKEVYAIVYALSSLVKQTDNAEIDGIKDIDFINSMNEYLFKLREYKIGRKFFENRCTKSEEADLFALQKGTAMRHPILNNIIIKDKLQLNNHTGLVVESKAGEYMFLK